MDEFFKKQFYPLNYIPIGIEGHETQAHQVHITKTSYIKPHIDPLNMEAFFITWFVKGTPQGGFFGVFQHCLKFDNDNGVGIWIQSTNIAHGTLLFNNTSSNDFKLSVAIVNKIWIHTRLQRN